jgi:hypothetical protein
MDYDIEYEGKKYPHRWNVPKHLRYKGASAPPFVVAAGRIMDRRDVGKVDARQYTSYDEYLKAANNKNYQSYEQLKRSYDLWVQDDAATGPVSTQEWYTRARRDW